MRHKSQKPLIQLSLFGSVLILIIFLGRSPPSGQTFAWNAIRYESSAPVIPEARGICPGLTETSKPALVVSRVAADGDPQWLDALADRYHLCVYTVDEPVDKNSVYLQVPANRGHEAMAYLTFMIDNYKVMPAAGAVFVHGSRWAWHNDSPDYDNAALLGALNVSAALEPWGYHNLRCDWSLSTCSRTLMKAQGSLETSMQATLEPWNARAVSDKALPGALAVLFGKHSPVKSDESVLLGRANAVRSQCCAQFVVARSRIWRHSRQEYVALRQWLLDGSDLDRNNQHLRAFNAAPRDDRVAGRILSYVWHILFITQDERNASGQLTDVRDGVDLERLNEQACPHASDCYCRLYGRCGLEGCTSERCYGQYRLPPNLKLPEDWAVSHA